MGFRNLLRALLGAGRRGVVVRDPVSGDYRAQIKLLFYL